jgi:hypothetical protein
MKAVVVYESYWGNTAAVARAVAEGIGQAARALPTDEADDAAMADVDLVVVGAPVIAFGLAGDRGRRAVEDASEDAPRPADLSHPPLRGWLQQLPSGRGWYAAFETRIWWSPRGATGSIQGELSRAGYRRLAKAEKFIVRGPQGPLRDGELERARQWGRDLAAAVTRQLAQAA